jgi:hypothetical protein
LGLVGLLFGTTVTNVVVLDTAPWLPLRYLVVGAVIAGALAAEEAVASDDARDRVIGLPDVTHLRFRVVGERLTMINRLREGFDGMVLGPGDDGYDAARAVWNAMVDRELAVIARARACGCGRPLRYGRVSGLQTGVRGGRRRTWTAGRPRRPDCRSVHDGSRTTAAVVTGVHATTMKNPTMNKR